MHRFILLCFAVSLSGCNAQEKGTLRIDRKAFVQIERFSDSHPLPPGWEMRPDVPENGLSGTNASAAGYDAGAASGAAKISAVITYRDRISPGSSPERDERIVLSRKAYAPAVELWDEAENATGNDIEAGTYRILSLDEIMPPLKALPVDGLYPGDPSYPLIYEDDLSLAGGDESLREWFRILGEKIGHQRDERNGDSEASVTWVAAAGDLMLARGVDTILKLGQNGIGRVFSDILPEMRVADLLLGNLEGPVTRRGIQAAKGYTFRFIPEALPALRSAGFDYLSVTNNHAFDYGVEGFLDTIRLIGEAGIGTSGAGTDLVSASKPWETTVRDLGIAVYSLSAYPVERSGWNGRKETVAGENRPGVIWEGETSLRSLRSSVRESVFDIVMIHGGEEWQNSPGPGQRGLYESIIEAGADLVIGSHPHVLQPIGVSGGRLIFYSLGNFVFPGMQETEFGEESILPVLGIYEGAVRYVRLIPVRLSGTGVARDGTGRILPRFLSMTRKENEMK